MPLFQYTALKEPGKPARGVIDADSIEDAKQKLLRKQILIIRVVPHEQKKSALKVQEVRSFTCELAHLLRAGLPLHESLAVLEEKMRGQKMGVILLDLCDQIRGGVPFSEALTRHAESFDVLYRSMIANAEQSGAFVPALEELAHLLERKLRLQKALSSALLYPALLSGFCLLVLSILLFFVIPSLFDLFEGRSLHPFTRFVFACSHFVLSAKWGIAAVLAGCGGGCAVLMSSKKGICWLRAAFARFPLIRELLIKVALARYFRAVATLIEGGLPALSALQQANTSLQHPPLEQNMQEVIERLSQGISLERALQGRAFVPPLIPRMLGIAQQAGNLSTMMHQIALIYEEELEQLFARITSLAQPILLLILGAMVGFVLLSVLLPLTDVSSFAAS
jgi:general secretion pathway protein F